MYIGGNSPSPKSEDYRVKLTKNIAYELDSQSFKTRSKDGREGAFVRNRVFTISKLVVLIMSLSRAIQRELDSFFRKLSNSEFSIREATKGAFTQARAKLNPWAFIRLNEVAVTTFYNEAEHYLWHDMRTLAVDGTRLVLPNHPSVVEEFGQHNFGPKADSKRSLAIASMLYDVLNQVTIDAQIAPYSSSESDLLIQHLSKVEKGDLLLTDRGYPSYALLFLLMAKGIHFCIRMKENWWLKVKRFRESDKNEELVTFTLPKKDRKKLADYPDWVNREITCRLIKVELENGEIEILCTSLIDEQQYPHPDFKDLYHLRWDEEEAYKLLKSRVELEDFSGKTAIAVKQDFHAKVFLLTLCATYAHPIEERVIEEYKKDENRKHQQKVNKTNAIAMTKDILIAMLLKKNYRKALDAFDKVVHATREIVRPGRSVERKHKQKRTYSMIYKRL